MSAVLTPQEFAIKLAEIASTEILINKTALKKSCELIQETAKEEFGVYQTEVGPYPAWAELADSTKRQRLSQGYTENDPLLRSGALKDSISHEVGEMEAVVGSDSDIMIYHEFGTGKVPPRAVLGPALYRNKEQIQDIFALAALMSMMNRAPK